MDENSLPNQPSPPEHVRFAVRTTAQGYDVEWAIDWSFLTCRNLQRSGGKWGSYWLAAIAMRCAPTRLSTRLSRTAGFQSSSHSEIRTHGECLSWPVSLPSSLRGANFRRRESDEADGQRRHKSITLEGGDKHVFKAPQADAGDSSWRRGDEGRFWNAAVRIWPPHHKEVHRV